MACENIHISLLTVPVKAFSRLHLVFLLEHFMPVCIYYITDILI